MNTRNKLLNALNGLELSFKKKEEFVDTLLNNVPTDGDGECMKFYDVSQVIASNESSKIHPILLCGMLLKLNISDNIIITTGSAFGEDPSLAEVIIAIGVDLSQKMINLSGESSFADLISPILSEITEITKEEFYHIPKDEVWALYTQEDYKAAWDKLYPLVERYGASYINENKLSLNPWYKSLTLESEWGDISLSEIVEYYHEFNDESKKDVIGFNGCALIKQYKDGDIIYRLSIYDS